MGQNTVGQYQAVQNLCKMHHNKRKVPRSVVDNYYLNDKVSCNLMFVCSLPQELSKVTC